MADSILIDEQSGSCNDQTLDDTCAEFVEIEKGIRKTTGFLQHGVLFDGLVLVNNRAGRSHDEFKKDHMHGRKDRGIHPAEHQGYKNGENNRYVNRDDILDSLLEI